MKLNVFTPLKIVLSIAGRWGVWGRGLRRVSCSQMRLSKAKPMVGPGHSHPREPTTVKIVLSVLTHVSLKEGRAQSDFTLCSDCSAGGWRQEGGGSPAEHSQAARSLRKLGAHQVFQTQPGLLFQGRAWPSPSFPQTYRNLFYPPWISS